MIAPNAEVGKSVATSLLSAFIDRAAAALAYRGGIHGDWIAPKPLAKISKILIDRPSLMAGQSNAYRIET
jgi:hypothetical protein